MVEWLFLAVPGGCLRVVIVVFPDHTHLLFFNSLNMILLERYTHLVFSHLNMTTQDKLFTVPCSDRINTVLVLLNCH